MSVVMERITTWRRFVATGLAACTVALIASSAPVAATGSQTKPADGTQTAAAPASAGPHSTVPFGVYDPDGDFANDPNVQIEHIFMPWEDVSLDTLHRSDSYALARHRALLVTIEPWTWSRSERNTPAALIRGISDGTYDRNMSSICTTLGSLRSPVIIRWAQEMDNAHRFIWSGWPPETYISAFRRMVTICRVAAPSIRYMWSPLGNENMAQYYPGNNYVDLVGISVFGYQPYDRGIIGHDQDFYEIMNARYARAAQFGKPVVVAELGYSGDQAYVDKWTDEIRNVGKRYPQLVGLVYFNYPEPDPWPHGYGKPDWRVGHRVIKLPNG